MRRSFVVAVTLWIALCTVSTARESPTEAAVASDKANALFDEYWEWTLREYPDFATLFGDRRYDDRLRDESAQAVAKRKAFYATLRGRLVEMNPSDLPSQVRTSLQVLRFRLDRIAALDEQFGSLPFGPYDACDMRECGRAQNPSPRPFGGVDARVCERCGN